MEAGNRQQQFEADRVQWCRWLAHYLRLLYNPLVLDNMEALEGVGNGQQRGRYDSWASYRASCPSNYYYILNYYYLNDNGVLVVFG